MKKYCILLACTFSCAYAGNSISRRKALALQIEEAAPFEVTAGRAAAIDTRPHRTYVDLAYEIKMMPAREIIYDEKLRGLNELFALGFTSLDRAIRNLAPLIKECRHLPVDMVHEIWVDAIESGKKAPFLCRLPIMLQCGYHDVFEPSWELVEAAEIDEALTLCALQEQSYPDNASIIALKGYFEAQKQLFVNERPDEQ